MSFYSVYEAFVHSLYLPRVVEAYGGPRVEAPLATELHVKPTGWTILNRFY